MRKRRGNNRYIAYFVIALLLTVAIGAGIYRGLMQVSWFNLQKVQIVNNQTVPDSLIVKIVDPYMGKNILSISRKELSEQIAGISRIKSVKVKRRLLHGLRIVVSERSGFLYLKSLEGDLYPIDSEAKVLERFTAFYSEDLPVVSTFLTGKQISEGQLTNKTYLRKILDIHRKIVEEMPDFASNISEYYMVDDAVHAIDVRFGTRFIPSEDDLISQLKRYQFVQDNGSINRNTLIDLRFKNQVVVKAGK